MADVRPLILQAAGSKKQAAQADVLLVDGLKSDAGTLTMTATTMALGSTNMTLGSGNITGSAGAVLSGFDSIEGITSANLVDKTAEETITNKWTFQSGDDEISVIAKASGSLTANGVIFAVQDSSGTNLFTIDKEGDMTVQGNETIVGATTFQGNVTFGDAITDTITFTGRIATGTDIIPIADGSSDLGSTALRMQTVYSDTVETAHLHSVVGAADTIGEALTLESGDGGASSGGGAGGAGAVFTIVGGTGGVGSGTELGGAGSATSLSAGTGGDSSGATGTAGVGGLLTISGGAAGAANGGTGGDGGGLTLIGGAGTTATDGTITIGATATETIEIGASAIPVNIAGVVTIDGNSTIGDAVTDTITFTGRIASATDLIPIADGNSDLGTSALRFQTIFVDTIGDSGQVLTIAGGISVSADAAHAINLLDNTANAFDIQEGANEYISIDTTDAAPQITFGGPAGTDFLFTGDGDMSFTTGAVDAANGTLDVPAGTSMLIGGNALSANWTQANIDELTAIIIATDVTGAELETLTDGSNADGLHTHSSLAATDIQDSDWTTAGVATGELVTATSNLTAAQAIATSEATSRIVGVVTAAGTVAYAGRVSVVGDDGSTPSIGTLLFLSSSTAGRWTATAPTTLTEVVAPIGVVVDDTGYDATAGNTIAVVLNFTDTTLL